MSKKFNRRGGGGAAINNSMLKKAQAMQEKLMKSQEELKNKEFVGTAAGGLVEITLNGDIELKKIKLDADIVDADDIELLEDSIIAAFNDAKNKLNSESESGLGGLSDMMKGMNIPGLF